MTKENFIDFFLSQQIKRHLSSIRDFDDVKFEEHKLKHFLKNKKIAFSPNVCCYTQFEHAESEQLRQHTECIALRNKIRFSDCFFSLDHFTL